MRIVLEEDSSLIEAAPPSTSQPDFVLFGGSVDSSGSYPGDTLWGFVASTLTWQSLPFNTSEPKPQSRAYHSSSVVEDSVYIYGGEYFSLLLNDLWSFNYSINAWTNLGNGSSSSPWPAARSRHSMVTASETMYVFGGCGIVYSLGCPPRDDLWVYDPLASNGTSSGWTRIKPANSSDPWPPARQGHGAVALNGSMLIYGGMDSNFDYLNDLWSFDFATQIWTQLSSSPSGMGVYQPGAVGFSYYYNATENDELDESVKTTMVIFGGQSACVEVNTNGTSLQTFDTTTGVWNTIHTPMPYLPFIYSTVMEEGSQLLYVLSPSGDLAQYSVSSNTWTTLAPVNFSALSDLTSSTWTGFFSANSTHLVAIKFYFLVYYEISSNSWSLIGTPSIFSSGSVVSSGINTAIALNGKSLATYNLLDIKIAHLPSAPVQFTAPVISFLNGYLYVIGGQPNPNVFYTYEVSSSTWNTVPVTTSDGSLGPDLSIQSPSVANVGIKIILFGGLLVNSSIDMETNDLWELDTTTNQWTNIVVSNSPSGRSISPMVAINSTLYLFGGDTQFDLLTDFWSIDLACNPGSYCVNNLYAAHSCVKCEQGSYSSAAGTDQCLPCPAGLTTNFTGASLLAQCSMCEDNYCHSGKCQPTLSYGANCTCDWGFSTIDRCLIPWLWLGIIGATLVFVVVIAFIGRKVVIYRRSIQDKNRLLEEKDIEITQMTDVWKIDESELKWIEHLKKGGLLFK